MTPEQFARLPKFAREEMRRLQRKLIIATEEISTLTGNDMDTEIWYSPSLHMGDPYPLPKYSQGMIMLGNNRRNSVSFRKDYDENFILVDAHSARLVIQPWSSNLIRLWSDN